MPAAGRRVFGWTRSLGVRIVLFLSIALLPIGLIALYQTHQVGKQTRRQAELAMLAVTERAAQEERRVVQRAFGIIDTLSGLADLIGDDPAICERTFQAVLRDNPEYSFIGIVKSSGMMTCASTGAPRDLSDSPGFQAFIKDPRQIVRLEQNAPLSGRSVIIASEPFFIDGHLAGSISVSIPHSGFSESVIFADEAEPLDLITFNHRGDIVTAKNSPELALRRLPRGRPLTGFSGQPAAAFTELDSTGEEHVYTVAPIVPGVLYAMGIWDQNSPMTLTPGRGLPTSLFPLLMWLASLAVAYVAVNRLVIRHIRSLSRQMQNFKRNRTYPVLSRNTEMATEMAQMQEVFLDMADGIVRDEAKLEDSVHEKNVLLKEVHHRVKNNLQLMSSIMNMQMRQSRNPETRAVLGRLQQRILGLARVHRSLYETQQIGRVEIGALICDIVDQSVTAGRAADKPLKIVKDVDKIYLYPDQAVPLSLLAAEAATNAIKYTASGEEPAWMSVTLREDGDFAVFEISNPALDQQDDADRVDGTGLGSGLIRAFAIQLNGALDAGVVDGVHSVRVRFPVETFSADPQDY